MTTPFSSLSTLDNGAYVNRNESEWLITTTWLLFSTNRLSRNRTRRLSRDRSPQRRGASERSRSAERGTAVIKESPARTDYPGSLSRFSAFLL